MSSERANRGAVVSAKDPGSPAPKKRRRLNPKRRLVVAIQGAIETDERLARAIGVRNKAWCLRPLSYKYGHRYKHLFPLGEQEMMERLKSLNIVFAASGPILHPRKGWGFITK